MRVWSRPGCGSPSLQCSSKDDAVRDANAGSARAGPGDRGLDALARSRPARELKVPLGRSIPDSAPGRRLHRRHGADFRGGPITAVPILHEVATLRGPCRRGSPPGPNLAPGSGRLPCVGAASPHSLLCPFDRRKPGSASAALHSAGSAAPADERCLMRCGCTVTAARTVLAARVPSRSMDRARNYRWRVPI